MKIRKTISILMAAVLASSALTVHAKDSEYLGRGTVGDKWYASSVYGAVTKDTEVSLKDDYFTAVVRDELVGTKMEAGYSYAGVFRDADKIMRDRTLALLRDTEPASHDGRLVSSFYELATDWKGRNKAGLAAVRDGAERIKTLQTLDDITAYLADGSDALRPLLMKAEVANSFADPGNYTVHIGATPLFLEDAKEYSERTEDGELAAAYHNKVVRYMLGRLGFTKKQSEQILADCEAFETAVSSYMLTREEYYADDIYDKVINVYSLEELRDMQGNFPLVEMLEADGMQGSDTYDVYEPKWLAAMSMLYTEENVGMIRSYLLAHYVFDMASKADRAAYDANVKYSNERYGITGTKSEEEIGLDIIDKYLSQPLDYAYIDAYCSEEERQRVIDLIYDFESYYRTMLEQEDWLSETTKQRAIEKLDHITIRACYPDVREDYSHLTLRTKSEGGTYMEALQLIEKYQLILQQLKINQKVDPRMWSAEMSTRQVNAYYDPSDNSINILSGILVGVFSMDQPYEAVLATVGETIGHEISHAFDTNGAQFDQYGNYENWWEEEDYAAFNERADRLAAYMNQIVPFEGAQAVNGEMEKGEMIADMGGMKASLMAAADHPGFDYDLFFRTYANSWLSVRTKNSVVNQLQTDPHPLENLRVNIPLQHCDEFMALYGIQPGDGMYLAPVDRVNVW